MTTPLQQAIEAMRAGKKSDARRLLAQIVSSDRRNINAWFLLSFVVETKEQKADCLRIVLSLKPTHAEAQKRLATLFAVPSSQVELVVEAQENIGTAKEAKTPKNTVVESPKTTVIPTSIVPGMLVLDDLVEQWLAVLTYTERKVLEYLYLNANRFSVAAVGRIISVSTKEVNRINQRAFAKLSEESSCVIAEPILSPLFELLQTYGESIGESELSAELRRKLVVQEIDPLGVARLILALQRDVDEENASRSNGMKAKRSKSAGNRTPKKEITVHVTTSDKEKRFVIKVSEQPHLSDKQLAMWKEDETLSERPHLSVEQLAMWKEDKTLIEELNLSRRSFNALKRAGINTVGQLVALYPEQIWAVKNMGATSIAELEKQLSAYIGENQPPVPYNPQPNEPEQIDSAHEAVVPIQINQTEALDETFLPLIHDKTSIEALNLSRRTFNAVYRSGISTVGQLVSLSPEQLWQIKNIGEKAIREVENQLEAYLAEYDQLSYLNPSTVEPTPPERAPAIDPELLNRLAAVPLNEISIERLGLSEIVNRGLDRQEISSIEQLLQHGENLVSDGKIGDPLKNYLLWLVEQDEAVWADEIAGKGISPLHQLALADTSLGELMSQWLSVLRERGRQVIHWRHGLDGELQTLQEIGQRLDITRERVRQLEKRALRILQSRYNGQARDAFRPLIALLRHKLAENGSLLSHSEISSWIESENSIRLGNINPLEAISLICQMDTQFHCLPKLEIIALNQYSVDSIVAIQVAFASILSEKLIPTSSEELFEDFKHIDLHEMLRDWPEVYPDEFILACLRVHPEIEQIEPGLFALKKWANRRLDEMILALHQLGEPSHYSVIAKKTNALLPSDQQTNAHNIHAHMGRLPEIFVRVGHGIFGLAEWGLHDDGNVANAAYRVIKEAGKPLHIDVITREVLKTWHVQPGSVYAAIQIDGRFIGIGSGVYYLRDLVSEADKVPQVDFGDLYGDELARWQIEFDKQSGRGELGTQNEVDAIRSLGLDFFAD